MRVYKLRDYTCTSWCVTT